MLPLGLILLSTCMLMLCADLSALLTALTCENDHLAE
jgi:hypothetical protein